MYNGYPFGPVTPRQKLVREFQRAGRHDEANKLALGEISMSQAKRIAASIRGDSIKNEIAKPPWYMRSR